MEIGIILFIIGWFFGQQNEKKHFKELEINERRLDHIIISNERFYKPILKENSNSHLVMGSVVIAQDYFKMSIANLMSLFGMNLITYESLLERARREAILRMKEQAYKRGHNQIYGIRLEVTTLNPLGQMVEAIAYGTSVKTVVSSQIPPESPRN